MLNGARFSAIREHPWLTAAIVTGLLIRILYDVVSVESGEFINWTAAAISATTEPRLPLPHLGIYITGSYMFSLAYRFWLALPVEHPPLLGGIYFSADSIRDLPVFRPSFANYIFVLSMKSPIVLFDVLILLLIVRVVGSKTGSSRTALLAAVAWAWNPLVTLLENYNGIDLAAAFFILLPAYLFERKRTSSVSIAVAIGTLLRLVPLLLLPVYALVHVRKQNWSELAKLLLPGSLLLGGALWVYTSTYGFGLEGIIGQRPGLLVYETLAFMGPVLKPRLGIAWNGFIAMNFVSYFVLAWLTSSGHGQFGDQISSVLLAFFATSWFHFAFFLWILPFLTIENLGLNRRLVLYLLLTAAGLLWTVFQASTAVFSYGTSIFFIPVSPDLYPISRTLATLQFTKGLEILRDLLTGALLAQLAVIVRRNLPAA